MQPAKVASGPPVFAPLEDPVSRLSFRSKTPISPALWIGTLVLVAGGDYLTGQFIHSAILFYLIPVALAAWSSRSRWPSVALACAWPVIRLGIVALWGWPWPRALTIQDAAVDAVVSVGFATLVWQLRQQARTIRTLEGILPMCGFCQRIRTNQGWERLESYLLDHSNARISHTFCPDCGRAHYGDLVSPAAAGPGGGATLTAPGRSSS
jgi:hypothetical protein